MCRLCWITWNLLPLLLDPNYQWQSQPRKITPGRSNFTHLKKISTHQTLQRADWVGECPAGGECGGGPGDLGCKTDRRNRCCTAISSCSARQNRHLQHHTQAEKHTQEATKGGCGIQSNPGVKLFLLPQYQWSHNSDIVPSRLNKHPIIGILTSDFCYLVICILRILMGKVSSHLYGATQPFFSPCVQCFLLIFIPPAVIIIINQYWNGANP